MTDEERAFLRSKMTQIFDNDIAPYMEFKREIRPTPKLIHDDIIKVQSFEFTDREKKRISLALKYGPDSAWMKDDGPLLPSQKMPRSSWCGWIFGKFLGLS
jgi:hypothetical protein